MNIEKTEKQHYAALFKKLNTGLGQSDSDLATLQRQAGDWFAANGFPDPRDEEWRFTDISPIRSVNFQIASPEAMPNITLADIQPFLFENGALPRLVFVNGRFAPTLASIAARPPQVTLLNLHEALKKDQETIVSHLGRYADWQKNSFAALNTALMTDGAFLSVADSAVIEKPILLLFIAMPAAKPTVVFPRNLFVIGKNAQVSFIESYVSFGKGTHFTNAVSEVALADHAVVEHYKLQLENGESFHTSTIQVQQARGSSYRSHNFAFGGQIARNDVNVMLNGEGAECTLNGLYLTGGKQLVDNHTLIEHVKPHCNSREHYKGILSDQARAVFSGKIHVHKDAQKTDAVQSNQNLLLSEEATVDTKPQLEIYADDVRCTHGGTVGQLDEEALFYLRARGISRENAKKLMIHAFAGQVIEAIRDESLREHVTSIVSALLAADQQSV
jgi:Fe-S cluster assembly protein SufD